MRGRFPSATRADPRETHQRRPLGSTTGFDLPGRGGALVVAGGGAGSCFAGSEGVADGEDFFDGEGHPGRPGFVVSDVAGGFEVTDGSEGGVDGGSSALSSHQWCQQPKYTGTGFALATPRV